MYVYPTATHAVSDSFAAHVARGSVNPGTDYIVFKVPVVSVAAGLVTDVDLTPGGSGGRMVHVDHDDGTGADYLHLDSIHVRIGDRVFQGELLAISGNSGDPVGGGSYGYHLHISFRRNHSHGYSNVGNIDFDALMQAQTSAASSGNVTPIRPQPVPDQTRGFNAMYFIRHAATGAIAVIFPWMNDGQGSYRHVNAPEWAAAQANGYKAASLVSADWQEIMHEMTPTSGVVGK